MDHNAIRYAAIYAAQYTRELADLRRCIPTDMGPGWARARAHEKAMVVAEEWKADRAGAEASDV